ncbi:MAG: chromosomal replication initiator protein DnaA [Bdellovibrionales bacterium GWA2_49_15]|nr:MAG: chromosomal replication initiator protein DnaA [Bdellovibrionales bacterium GWA2_49_15]
MSGEFPFDHFLKKGQLEKPFSSPQTPSPQVQKSNENNDIGELRELETEILGLLKDSIPKQKFNAYFENTFEIVTFEGNQIIFSCSTQFIQHIISSQYLTHLENAILATIGKKVIIDIQVRSKNASLSSNDKNIFRAQATNSPGPEKTSENVKTPVKKPGDFKFLLDLNQTTDDLTKVAESKFLSHVRSDFGNTLIDSSKTFDTFIVGNSNAIAHATALAVASDPSRQGKQCKYQCLYIHSDSGLGKTHLLHAIANKVREIYPNLVVALVTARDFTKEMVSSIQDKTMADFQKKYSEVVDILMVDDIHELRNKPATQNEFFHIFNELQNRGKQLVFTSDKLPSEIDGIPERLRTRLQWGLLIDIQRPDFETRLAILKRKSAELDLYLQEDIFQLMASNLTHSIRELEGYLIRLSAHKDLLKVEIDIEMAKEVLNLSSKPRGEKISAETITKVVANFYKIPVIDIRSKSRTKKITHSRHVAMYLVQKHLSATLAEIGNFFGGRDHTSVIHGIKKIEQEIQLSGFVKQEISNLESALSESSEVF